MHAHSNSHRGLDPVPVEGFFYSASEEKGGEVEEEEGAGKRGRERERASQRKKRQRKGERAKEGHRGTDARV